MHSKFISIYAIAALSFIPIFSSTVASAIDWPNGQEILIECPVWEWEPSSIPVVEYELCFDDIDHCVVAEIGSSVCIPSLGAHDVWVTAIDYQDGEPIYYDGDIVPVARVMSADFDGDSVVGFSDLGLFIQQFGEANNSFADLDGDGSVGFMDFSHFSSAFGKCINASGTVYTECHSQAQ
ncbi:MAG: hypothetical protein JRE43_05845 [Deltaproteobacteria bacterium]|jgi:hypothetical protein|nr:hypothetical protein [Deltaproteobacteria bacterium]MBW2541607.1 hypothetical protein [Deltaproteobacteria bacterium]